MFTYSLVGGALALAACPWISEIHADSDPLEDRVGEFIEVAVPSGSLDDSLILGMNGEDIGLHLEGGRRLVFCHSDSLRILPQNPVACTPLQTSIPNSTPLQITLRKGFCRDTAWVESARSGKSWQHTPDEGWSLALPTPGFANPEFEEGVLNAFPSWGKIQRTEEIWEASFQLNQASPNTMTWSAEWFSLDSDSILFRENGSFLSTNASWTSAPKDAPAWIGLRVRIEGDDYPIDNRISTILYPEKAKPLQLQEIAAAPPEDWPDWIEFRNMSAISLPLFAISTCNEMAMSDSSLFLAPGEIAIITGSKGQLLEKAPSLAGVKILETANAWTIRNSADTVRICLWDYPVDSVMWLSSKNMPNATPTPGWQASATKPTDDIQLQSRIISKSKLEQSLRIHLPSKGEPWSLSLFQRDGLSVLHKNNLLAGTFTWTPPASLEWGPCKLVLRSKDGKRKQMGVILVP